MNYGIGCRHGLDPELLWLWVRLVAAAPIQLPCARHGALKSKKKKKGGGEMEENTLCKWKSKEYWSSSTHIRQKSALKNVNKSQRRTLHNDQRTNPKSRYNNRKYIYKYRNTSICKAIAHSLKRRNWQHHNNRDLNTLLIVMDTSSRQKNQQGNTGLKWWVRPASGVALSCGVGRRHDLALTLL